MVEQSAVNRSVAGSSPAVGAFYLNLTKKENLLMIKQVFFFIS